ncbi:MAG: hypothetical protein CMJ19_01350 [Phycisphaeraceae bacterium]|nr:hypothetical protein [Phycisphaeraceae bacterium]
MKQVLTGCLMFVMLFCPASVFGQTSDNKSKDKSSKPSFADYQEVVDTNIFIRRKPIPKRNPQTEAQTPTTEAPPPPAPVNKYLLCGIIIENDDRFTAMIEDALTHTLQSVHIGDKVNVFEITSMTISSVILSLPDGRNAELFIGQSIDANGNLLQSGWIPTAKSTSSGSDSGQSSGSETKAAEPASEKELSILEKLRRRRESQLNK